MPARSSIWRRKKTSCAIATAATPSDNRAWLARRLVEHGVPYVTINYPGWDTHKEHFQTMQRKLPELDKGLSSCCRTCRVAGCWKARSSGAAANSAARPRSCGNRPGTAAAVTRAKSSRLLVAGGGFKGGHVVGSSTEKGEEVKERPVYPVDLIGSMYELLGIDTRRQAAPSPGPTGHRIAHRRRRREDGRTLERDHVNTTLKTISDMNPFRRQ